jgi:hypothetical protein
LGLVSPKIAGTSRGESAATHPASLPRFLSRVESLAGLGISSSRRSERSPSSPRANFFDNVRQEYLSEDFAFCRLCRTAGIDIWLDTEGALIHTGSCDYANE